jgi:hypothetical protein
MTADEHQSQTVVTNFLFWKNWLLRCSTFAVHRTNNFSLFLLEHLPASHDIQREVSGSAHDPCGRVFRNSIKGPGLQRPGQRFLDHVFGQIEMLYSKNPRQDGDHLSRLATEKVLNQLGHFLRLLDNSFQLNPCKKTGLRPAW